MKNDDDNNVRVAILSEEEEESSFDAWSLSLSQLEMQTYKLLSAKQCRHSLSLNLNLKTCFECREKKRSKDFDIFSLLFFFLVTKLMKN